MAQGMCPGCGDTGSAKAINSHIGGCRSYAQRFAAGDVLLSPEDEFRRVAAERAPAPAPRVPRAPRTELSDPGATVSEPAPPKKAPRPRSESVEVLVRTPAPVFVEYWEVPQSL